MYVFFWPLTFEAVTHDMVPGVFAARLGFVDGEETWHLPIQVHTYPRIIEIIMEMFNTRGWHCTRAYSDRCLFIFESKAGRRVYMSVHIDDC